MFGINLNTKETKSKTKLETFELEYQNGVENIINPYTNSGSNIAYAFDLVQIPTDEIELILKYRNLAKASEIDLGLQEIRNEVFVFDVPDKRAINLSFFDNTQIPEKTRKQIIDEFVNIYNLMDFHNKGIEYFMDWYIDGRLFLQKVIDSNNQKEGIKQFVKISPTNIKKIREYQDCDKNGIYDLSKMNEYYVYYENTEFFTKKNKNKSYLYGGYSNNKNNNTGLRISKESIIYIDSGIYDEMTNTPLSNLHKAIVPYNNLKLLEDSHVIYMVTRAPSRRIFYVDTGNLAPPLAEAKVKSLMENCRTKLAYNPETGGLVDRRNIMSMVEDFWFARQGDKTTEIQELAGMDDQSTDLLEFYKQKLQQSLNVPYSRLSTDSSYEYGKGTAISRDEDRFKKFISRIRQQFMFIFEDALK